MKRFADADLTKERSTSDMHDLANSEAPGMPYARICKFMDRPLCLHTKERDYAADANLQLHTTTLHTLQCRPQRVNSIIWTFDWSSTIAEFRLRQSSTNNALEFIVTEEGASSRERQTFLSCPASSGIVAACDDTPLPHVCHLTLRIALQVSIKVRIGDLATK